MSASASPSRACPEPAAVRDAVAAVPDPELPAVTVGDLGMIHAVEVADDGAVAIDLLPTFAGCPATDLIRADVEAAVRALPGVGEVTVRFRLEPRWTPARIGPAGHERLRSFGIAPPAGDGACACPYCASTRTERDSAFGPTPCRAIEYCTSCRQPFESFKDL